MSINKTSLLKLYPGAVKRAADINPLVSSLIGAGLGAGAGAGYTYYKEKDPEVRKKKMKTALMAGALGGGTLGAAVALLGGKVKTTFAGDKPSPPALPNDQYRESWWYPAPIAAGAAGGTAGLWKGRRMAAKAKEEIAKSLEKSDLVGDVLINEQKAMLARRGLNRAGAKGLGIGAATGYLGSDLAGAIAEPTLVRGISGVQNRAFHGDKDAIVDSIVDLAVHPISSPLALARNAVTTRFGADPSKTLTPEQLNSLPWYDKPTAAKWLNRLIYPGQKYTDLMINRVFPPTAIASALARYGAGNDWGINRSWNWDK